MIDSNHPNELVVSLEEAQTMWRDRRRYFQALKIFLKIESSYRRLNEQIAKLDSGDKQHLFSKLHQRNAQLLYQLCETNGDIWITFAHFLCTQSNLLPIEYIERLEKLHRSYRSLPFLHLEVVLVEEWGANWEHYFEWVQEEPVATTTIAQIHNAKLVDGPEVAIKIQLPEVKRLFEQDALQLNALTKIMASRLPQFDLTPLSNTFLSQTEQALDFTHEKNNLEQFARLPHRNQIRTPKLLTSWCTQRVLMTEWIPGEKLANYIRSVEAKNTRQYLETLQESYLQQISQFGFYHMEIRPNHLLVSEECLYFVDYVAMARLSTAQRINYTRLLLTILNRDFDNLSSALIAAGIDNVNQQLIDDLSDALGSYHGDESPYHLLHVFLQELNRHQTDAPDPFVSIAKVLLSLDCLLKEYNVPITWQNILSKAG